MSTRRPSGFSHAHLERPSSCPPDPLVALGAPLYDDTSHETKKDSKFKEHQLTSTGSDQQQLLLDMSFAFDFESYERSAGKSQALEPDLSLPFDYSSTTAAESFATFNASLDSPLNDTPFSEFLVSPMFDDDDGSSLPGLDFSTFPLFPPQSQSVPAPASVAQSDVSLPTLPALPPTPSLSFLPSPAFSVTM
ncbi:hypothetical protein P7C70_g7976, partial [Phenoliferia sp. Uapishka_3]